MNIVPLEDRGYTAEELPPGVELVYIDAYLSSSAEVGDRCVVVRHYPANATLRVVVKRTGQQATFFSRRLGWEVNSNQGDD